MTKFLSILAAAAFFYVGTLWIMPAGAWALITIESHQKIQQAQQETGANDKGASPASKDDADAIPKIRIIKKPVAPKNPQKAPGGGN